MTLPVSQTNLFDLSDIPTFSVADFRAKLFQLREKDKVSQILEELSSLKLLASPLFSDLGFYSLKKCQRIAQPRKRGYVRDNPPNTG